MNIRSPEPYIKSLAADLECGPADEYFTDPQGGFYPKLLYAEAAIQRGLWSECRRDVEAYVAECEELYKKVLEEGWSSDNVMASKELSARLLKASWPQF